MDLCFVMLPDLAKYRPYVAHFDLTQDQKDELIHTLWRMMETAVDMAFSEDGATLPVIEGEIANSNGREGELESLTEALSDAFRREADGAGKTQTQ